MINVKDLWIGDLVFVSGKKKVGSFEGTGAKGLAFVKIDGKMHLINPNELTIHEEKEVEPELILEETKIKPYKEFNSEIDLHMEVLNPYMTETNPLHILQYQVKQVELFLESAIQRRRNTLKIIHGKGSGQLKEEVHHLLKGKKEVAHYHVINEGGATEVYIRP
jgi:dsDNA-specific endonuclease/ATPase MutS2